MAGERNDPYRNFRFRVEIDGIEQAGFSEVSGFEATFDVIEYREGDQTPTPRKLPGMVKYGNITLTWGTTESMELYEWIQECIQESTFERKEITIVALDEEGSDAATWQVFEVWPVRYSAPTFNGLGAEVAFEFIEFAHEGLLRIS